MWQRDIFLNDYSRGLNIRHDTYKTGQLFILLWRGEGGKGSNCIGDKCTV